LGRANVARQAKAFIEATSLCFTLTAKEAEVLYRVVKGKTNKDIGDILGSSPKTRIRQLHPQFEG
jgi:DNA-binding CsgD family transcriptional regulator